MRKLSALLLTTLIPLSPLWADFTKEDINARYNTWLQQAYWSYRSVAPAIDFQVFKRQKAAEMHPAYRVVQILTGEVSSNLSKRIDTSDARKAIRDILTQGKYFGGFNTSRRATNYDAHSALVAIRTLGAIEDESDKVAFDSALAEGMGLAEDDGSPINAHLNLIGELYHNTTNLKDQLSTDTPRVNSLLTSILGGAHVDIPGWLKETLATEKKWFSIINPAETYKDETVSDTIKYISDLIIVKVAAARMSARPSTFASSAGGGVTGTTAAAPHHSATAAGGFAGPASAYNPYHAGSVAHPYGPSASAAAGGAPLGAEHQKKLEAFDAVKTTLQKPGPNGYPIYDPDATLEDFEILAQAALDVAPPSQRKVLEAYIAQLKNAIETKSNNANTPPYYGPSLLIAGDLQGLADVILDGIAKQDPTYQAFLANLKTPEVQAGIAAIQGITDLAARNKAVGELCNPLLQGYFASRENSAFGPLNISSLYLYTPSSRTLRLAEAELKQRGLSIIAMARGPVTAAVGLSGGAAAVAPYHSATEVGGVPGTEYDWLTGGVESIGGASPATPYGSVAPQPQRRPHHPAGEAGTF